MAALKHVCMWTMDGWKPVTVEEAASLHPGGTVSHHSGLFMCSLCNQFVTLTGKGQYARHFRHSSREADKSCQERTSGGTISAFFSSPKHDLPLRIRMESFGFRFELGLVPLPESLARQYMSCRVQIQPEIPDAQAFVYNLQDRLQVGSTTWLQVGTEPAPAYRVTVLVGGDDTAENLKDLWPGETGGIPGEGALFDGKSGKKLPADADVTVKKKYWLLTSRLEREEYSPDLRVRKHKLSRWGWWLYEAEAAAFTEKAARFFIRYRCRLTKCPVAMEFLWPPCVRKPYRILHPGSCVTIYVRGDAETKAFPQAGIRTFPLEHGRILQVNCSGRQQMISSGRFTILRYAYLWEDPLAETADLPQVQVTDIRNRTVEGGEQTSLPENQILRIQAPCDGTVTVRDADGLVARRTLVSDTPLELNSLSLGQEITVCQGLDVVWSIRFLHPDSRGEGQDRKLLEALKRGRGRMVPVSHSLGSVVTRLKDCPETKKWLYREVIRTGCIPETSCQLLKAHLARLALGGQTPHEHQ